ncbi:histidine phosphatase family protein [Iamia sp. SCSIO 61187]|uniref:phosphoglycerate mutase family protein n=1 Tax=Iamia sp. SCSIO 61187 TaxID=2722752 RepID=UPI001C625AB7|nr:phosphoglycerate mutase family protein [Iamia sp. SCSIO 61187]QYG91866.1 histidine phosphatase family protein [Iamia sp. SCSIO 61187]
MSPERDGAQARWVVRHACAGHKEEWHGDDDARPLDPAGRQQAAALADALAPDTPRRLVASPTRRCVDTLAPLGARLGVIVELDPTLREATGSALVARLADAAWAGAVICTHGEVMGPALVALRADGLDVRPDVDDDALLLKGGAWRLEPGAGGTWRLELSVPLPVPACPHHGDAVPT